MLLGASRAVAVWSSKAWGGVLATVACAAAALLSHKATRIFHYCYTPDLRDKCAPNDRLNPIVRFGLRS